MRTAVWWASHSWPSQPAPPEHCRPRPRSPARAAACTKLFIQSALVHALLCPRTPCVLYPPLREAFCCTPMCCTIIPAAPHPVLCITLHVEAGPAGNACLLRVQTGKLPVSHADSLVKTLLQARAGPACHAQALPRPAAQRRRQRGLRRAAPRTAAPPARRAP